MQQQAADATTSIEHTSLGRIVVPSCVPDGAALFYTTIDFDGRLDDETTPALLGIVRERFGVSASQLISCTQVHGKRVSRTSGTECDALFTDAPGTALAIKVADCLPVAILDVAHGVAANIHSGWRGAVQNITAETLETLLRETAFDPRKAVAFLGPTIGVCCFEVGEEVAAQFDAGFVDRTRGAKPHVDVAAMTADLLRTRGIENIVDAALCTRCGDLFHSYRRDKRSGRNLAIAAI